MELADLWVYDVPARRNSNREQHRIICFTAIVLSPPTQNLSTLGQILVSLNYTTAWNNLRDVQNASCNIITWEISISEDDVVRSGMFLHIPA